MKTIVLNMTLTKHFQSFSYKAFILLLRFLALFIEQLLTRIEFKRNERVAFETMFLPIYSDKK